jgi:hypothetical protein
MNRTVLAVALVALPAAAEDPPKRDRPPEPELSFRQDGDDLVATATVRANGADHVLLTSHDKRGKDVVLRYTLIQNRDRLVRGEGDASRHLKEVKAEWRLKGQKKEGATFKVDGTYLMLTTAELEQLAREVGKLTGKRGEVMK